MIVGFVSAIDWSLSPLEAIVSAKAATFFVCLIVGIIFSLIYPDTEKEVQIQSKLVK
ncbi:hypothetical protein [Priestia megaterium]|uniref:hypothetical protein n=1 Tax=Priestia megaterium TaxID=1404 RepID=UPI002E24170C|nr:hypothetical protein [Priestia megaterium]MED4278668.1 hypothetical protein [Priestia megaterium]MED4319526.1 hypothetical protein [Priestia megaterium]